MLTLVGIMLRYILEKYLQVLNTDHRLLEQKLSTAVEQSSDHDSSLVLERCKRPILHLFEAHLLNLAVLCS